MIEFLARVLVNALAILVCATLVPGVELPGVLANLGVALVFALLNAIISPILLVLTLPLTPGIMSLFFLNALCLWLTSVLVKGLAVHGFGAAPSRLS